MSIHQQDVFYHFYRLC